MYWRLRLNNIITSGFIWMKNASGAEDNTKLIEALNTVGCGAVLNTKQHQETMEFAGKKKKEPQPLSQGSFSK